MKPLAEALVMDRTTLTRNLRPLAKQGWLSLRSSAKDGRSRVVTLTTAGEKALETAFPLWKRAQSAAKKGLGAAELATLGAALDRIRQWA
jgi:DNA-binding MarR family transcriptional regulator